MIGKRGGHLSRSKMTKRRASELGRPASGATEASAMGFAGVLAHLPSPQPVKTSLAHCLKTSPARSVERELFSPADFLREQENLPHPFEGVHSENLKSVGR